MTWDWLHGPTSHVVFAAMLILPRLFGDAVLSARNERYLREAGAVEPPDDVYPLMRIVYPSAFLAMFIESVLRGGPPTMWWAIGSVIWIAARALKDWAIATLGDRWCFRVLPLPNLVLVTQGPYRWMRHPNYLAVVGELTGAAVMLTAPVAGTAFTLGFLEILRRRIRVEERALGLRKA